MSHDSRGALLKKGDRVLVEFELKDDPTADGGYCNASCVAVIPEQRDKPPMAPPFVTFNTRMLTKVGAVAALLLLAVSFAAQVQGQTRLDRKVDGSLTYNIGREENLEWPTGPAQHQLTVVVSDAYQQSPREAQVISWFNTDARLRRYIAATNFNSYTTGNPLFRDRLRAKMGDAVPIVMLAKADGEVILNVTALSMPHSAGEMADLIAEAVEAVTVTPKFEGQTTATAIIQDCPDPNPGPPTDELQPPLDPLPEVLPNRDGLSWFSMLWAGGGGLATLLTILASFFRQPR